MLCSRRRCSNSNSSFLARVRAVSGREVSAKPYFARQRDRLAEIGFNSIAGGVEVDPNQIANSAEDSFA
jgi:hypothetical protein